MSLFHNQLVDLIPVMRAYALFLTGRRSDADDLVQQALEKALKAEAQFAPDTHMKAWVLTIVRNTHHNNWRNARRTVEDVDGKAAAQARYEERQLWSAEVADVAAAINRLDPDQRHALLLITAGLSYEEAARSCDAPLRTMQSRVRRARAKLAVLLADL